MKLRVLDLFSGIGGFSLGLERTGGFETVAFCEIEPYCRRVLAKHWPNIPCNEDINTLAVGRGMADVVTAGFPCQDLSFAGQGAGLSGVRSGLWWRVRRTIRVVRPRLALLENVAALLSRGMGTVLGSLAALGYDTEWHCIQAAHVGRPHARDRVWIAAHSDSLRKLQPGWMLSHIRGRVFYPFHGAVWPLPDSDGNGNDVRISGAMDALGNTIVTDIPELIGRAILEAERS